MGAVKAAIESKLNEIFRPSHLEVVNESGMHNVPKGSETHFRLVVVSEKFIGLKRIQRQRLINEVLKAELSGPVYALSQKLFTPDEWSGDSGKSSPPCHGGGH